tara:strand:- start:1277 stop:2062 length:786 start_codon:yes stop_codon:yes gene_type:complete
MVRIPLPVIPAKAGTQVSVGLQPLEQIVPAGVIIVWTFESPGADQAIHIQGAKGYASLKWGRSMRSGQPLKRLAGLAALVVVILTAGAWATVDHWARPLETLIWPPDEHGDRPYEIVSETAVHPYPGAKTVRLFVETDGPSSDEGWLEPQGRLLSAAQRAAFEATLSKRSSRGGAADACFIPHHFFRYYDDVGTLVAEIRVCFCCAGAGADASPALFPFEGGVFLHPFTNTLKYDRERLGALIRSWGLPSDVWCREQAEPR